MKALSVVAVVYAVAYSLVLLYGTSIPGGGTLTLSFAVVALFFRFSECGLRSACCPMCSNSGVGPPGASR